jgi:glucan biosynthesis protein C
VGYARAYLNSGGPRLRYATEVVYPFYIVHQTVMLAILFYIVLWNASLWLKLAIVAAGTFVVTAVIVEGIRRVRVLRPFFGLRV